MQLHDVVAGTVTTESSAGEVICEILKTGHATILALAVFLAVAIAAVSSSPVFAQYAPCPPGYSGGGCYPSYNNPYNSPYYPYYPNYGNNYNRPSYPYYPSYGNCQYGSYYGSSGCYPGYSYPYNRPSYPYYPSYGNCQYGSYYGSSGCYPGYSYPYNSPYYPYYPNYGNNYHRSHR